MEKTNYCASIALTKFFDAEVIERENDEGNLEKGVFIPLDKNDLKVWKGHVYSTFFINKCYHPKNPRATHYMTLYASKRFVQKMNSLGRKMPFMGTVYDSYHRVTKNIPETQYVKMSDYEQE